MKTILILLVMIVIGHCQDINNFYQFFEPKNEETDYDRICSDRNITIHFSGLKLKTIQTNFLSSPIITCLDLSNNEIESIDNKAFENLPNLKYLNMNGNLFKLHDILSYGHVNLETLLLDNIRDSPDDGYDINTIPHDYCYKNSDGYIEKTSDTMYNAYVETIYPKLKKLFVRNHQTFLKFTAATKYNFPSLTHLYLSGSTIAHDDFDWLPSTLEYLDLSGHNLETLTLTDLKNLKWIYLDNPIHKCLGRVSFKNLISLKYLSLPSNSINEITYETFANVTSLLFLDLSDNNIRYVEGGSFDNMKNLQYLNLSNNNIKVIQGGTFDKLKDLETLALEKNEIFMFPRISNELKLKSLSLNCNNLKSIGGRSFAKMPDLETLYLHGNQITYIDREAFAGLENLKILTLSDNDLSNLPTNWLIPMIKLEKLDLSGNRIVDFGHLALSSSSPVQYLYLSNQLTIIRSISLLDKIPENVTISLKEDDVYIEKCYSNQIQNNDPYQGRLYG